jgi:hypothetical protein
MAVAAPVTVSGTSQAAQRVSLVLLVLLSGLGSAACGRAQPALRVPTDNTASVAVSNVAYGEPRSVGSMSLCLTSPGIATITRVDLHRRSGDIRVEAFAVRPDPFARGLNGVGTDLRPLAEIGGGFDPGGIQTVSMVCPTEAQRADPTYESTFDEFAVQVSWASGDVSGGTGLDVTYRIEDVERTAVIPFGIWLCAGTCPDDVGS